MKYLWAAQNKTSLTEQSRLLMATLKRKPWTRSDLAAFRKLAKQGLSGRQIAKKLKRTVGATYQRATSAGIKFSSNRAPRKHR